jgi:hypothetical protein
MDQGYVKLWRKSLDSQVFQNDELWKLWCLCLMKANHKENFVGIDGIIEPIKVSPGQFITGRFSLHKDYYGTSKKNKSPLTVWRWLLKLEKMENLNIKTNNKYSIVSIINWPTYQSKANTFEQQNEQQMNNRRTTDEQQMNTNKNDKNVKNDNNTSREIQDLSTTAVISIPLIKKDGEFHITREMINEWEDTFPRVDILQALKHIRQWNKDNPNKRKTLRGIRSHITTWLNKAQNKGQYDSGNGEQIILGTTHCKDCKKKAYPLKDGRCKECSGDNWWPK